MFAVARGAGSKDDAAPRRLNRAVGVAEALGGALDPVFRKRGFASRDILTHWAAIAPPPYGDVAQPDKLVWPRGEKGVEGATLVLRCHPGHALALAHEGQRIVQAVNRYFGYVLVGQVRLSAEPLRSAPGATARPPAALAEVTRARIARTVEGVADAEMRDALRRLGQAIAQGSRRKDAGQP